jgi:predicted SprT family Zn-dependent metalloprotease
MDNIDLAPLMVHQHNAQMPREAEVVREVDRILRMRLFPAERVWVDVRFDYGMSDHSSSKVTLMQINGQVHGTAEVRFQGLFLWQDFPAVFNEVVPHELAHVLMEVRSAERGTDNEKGHSDEWLELVLDINPDAEPSAKVRGEFDDRAIKLQKGGIGCECDCDDLSAFVVLSNTPATVMKLKNEDLSCNQCHSTYRRLTKEHWPAEICSALTFYEKVMEVKVHHSPLTR